MIEVHSFIKSKEYELISIVISQCCKTEAWNNIFCCKPFKKNLDENKKIKLRIIPEIGLIL